MGDYLFDQCAESNQDSNNLEQTPSLAGTSHSERIGLDILAQLEREEQSSAPVEPPATSTQGSRPQSSLQQSFTPFANLNYSNHQTIHGHDTPFSATSSPTIPVSRHSSTPPMSPTSTLLLQVAILASLSTSVESRGMHTSHLNFALPASNTHNPNLFILGPAVVLLALSFLAHAKSLSHTISDTSCRISLS
jgi:hypothetical protein